MHIYVSGDGGKTWTTHVIAAHNPAPGELNDGLGGGFRVDPSVAMDANGTAYAAYLFAKNANINPDPNVPPYGLVIARSTDEGATWAFTVLDRQKRPDKTLLAVGPDGLGGQAVYLTYSLNDDEDVPVATVRGTNIGRNAPWGNPDDWLQPVTISQDPGEPQLILDPAVGRNGSLYIAWIDAGYAEITSDGWIVMEYDVDGLFVNGPNFHPGEPSIAPLTFDSSRPIDPQPHRGVRPIPVLDVDNSGGAFDGRLYITWADEAGTPDTGNWDIKLAYADTTNGVPGTWTVTTVDGASDTNANVNPWIDVDQASGSASVLYHRSMDGAPASANVVIKTSIDGGVSFGNRFTMSSATSNAGMVVDNLFSARLELN